MMHNGRHGAMVFAAVGVRARRVRLEQPERVKRCGRSEEQVARLIS